MTREEMLQRGFSKIGDSLREKSLDQLNGAQVSDLFEILEQVDRCMLAGAQNGEMYALVPLSLLTTDNLKDARQLGHILRSILQGADTKLHCIQLLDREGHPTVGLPTTLYLAW